MHFTLLGPCIVTRMSLADESSLLVFCCSVLLGIYRWYTRYSYIAATPVYEYSDPSKAELVKYKLALGGVVLQLLLLMLLLVLLPLLLLLLLRFGARRASGGVWLQLRCCCVALVLRPYY